MLDSVVEGQTESGLASPRRRRRRQLRLARVNPAGDAVEEEMEREEEELGLLWDRDGLLMVGLR